MFDFVFQKDSILETNTELLDIQSIESSSLQDILTCISRSLTQEIITLRFNLKSCRGTDQEKAKMQELLRGANLMQKHFDFIIAVLGTTSNDEISAVKSKYKQIAESYEKIKTKDDISLLPAKHAAVIMHDKIVNDLRKVIKKCFKYRRDGTVDLVRTEENFAWVEIMIDRLEFFDQRYPYATILPKDDIFSLEKSSPIWQELCQFVVIKNTLTQEEVSSDFYPLISKVHLIRILLKKHANYKSLSLLKTLFLHLKDLVYYGIQPAKAEAQALLHLVKPKLEEVFKPWKVAEHPLVCKYMELKFPWIGHDELIYVPRLFPAITKEVILKEYKNNTYNKVQPMDQSELMISDNLCNKSETLRELFVAGKNKIPVRILGPEKLNLRQEQPGFFKRLWNQFVRKASILGEAQPQQAQEEQAIVIHMHGGGFVALSSNTQKVYLTRWVKNLKVIHFSIDYRLAPDNKYPDALDDVWQAYLWIVNYAKTVLGIENQKIILTGDSAGGTLAMALALRLVKTGFKAPNGILVVYPALSMDLNSASPSTFLALNDSLLPSSIIKLVSEAYIEEEFKSDQDPFLSPLYASNELLEKMPPVRIVAGSQDPLGDDNWRFLAKLRKLKKDVKLIVHENLPHGYLGHQDLRNYDGFAQETSEMIRELIEIEA